MSGIVYFIFGVVALIIGAESLVKGASRLARFLRVSSVVIGLAVVAYGTSSPELAVSLEAALAGEADLADCPSPGTASPEWVKLEKNVGKYIYIDLNDGNSVHATLGGIKGDTMTIRTNSGLLELFHEADVKEIRMEQKRSVGKSVMIGTAIAAGVAFGMGMAIESQYRGDEDKGLLTGLMVTAALPVGAGIGLAHGLTRESKTLVLYKTPVCPEPDLSWYKLPTRLNEVTRAK